MKRVVPIIVDLVCVLVFAVVGRASHGLDLFGVLATAWPFLLACLIAWAAVAMTKVPFAGWREGLIVWSVTLVVGMVLRVVSGDTAAWAFVLVAALFLAVTLMGWRFVWRLSRHRSARTA
ncbi:DUF3054 domain-containing protein [Tessaracoccus sp. ZS01]|uniref:DUF3054 domain-containing protein n=1 Tax=Tessaracoccus sp. ZS01 TaxID=1906324 RepID=UPI00096D42C0|nr:DUF3054 domain-containing protein [Tessaracoccus sp. ZS01]MCG6566527.1 DUF3054 domain-containing protein [Tessaracoccus sp. ZS01]OMG59220.1 hypothetical protein BJN44_02640 [Tessaracoccus sp. ZS01]